MAELSESQTFTGGRIFDGHSLSEVKAVRFQNGVFHGLGDARDGERIDLAGDILSPGYVDLQVNGGDGLMFNDDPSVATLTRIATAHRRLGATRILPTLITDSHEKTQAAIRAGQEAVAARISGIGGLHLEGPHISVVRKGAHDAQHIRPMENADLQVLIEAKKTLPVLMVTLAPEAVTPEQVKQLAEAGVVVSLGHTDADFETCMSYAKAGARAVTHLFNAMSQLRSRAPGLVGAALQSGELSAGLIADGIHVHPAAMSTAWAGKCGPGAIYLVSDAMAVAGTDLDRFELNGRRITRQNGHLRLSDGTLAGADLDLTRAVSVLVGQVGVPLEEALRAVTENPASLCGMALPRLEPGVTQAKDLIRIKADLSGAAPLID